MLDNQYFLFLDIDRRCAAGGLKTGECLQAVRMKRASIESGAIRANPLAQEVLAGRTTFVAVYDSYSRGFRGLRRFVPKSHDPAWNERLQWFGAIVPNVRHFTRRSLLALDNPVGCAGYGILAAIGFAAVWAHGNRDDGEAFIDILLGDAVGFLVLLLGLAGFALGSYAMLRYRTRDMHLIHAREAAVYMDLNYACYRAGDDEAWMRAVWSRTPGEASEARTTGGVRAT
jgi:hypothetical protein